MNFNLKGKMTQRGMFMSILLCEQLLIDNINLLHEKLKTELAVSSDEIRLNFEKVKFMDTANLQLILAFKKHAGNENKKIIFENISEALASVIKIFGAQQIWFQK